jgi:tol-pal system protein YbgF
LSCSSETPGNQENLQKDILRRRLSGGFCIALAFAPLLLSTGCSSSQEFETLHGKLEDIQLLVLELRKEGSTKDEIASLEVSLLESSESLEASQSGVSSELAELTENLLALESKLDDTNFRLAQLSLQIAATNQELLVARNAAEEARRRPTPLPVTQPSDPKSLYETTYDDYIQGNYDLAILGFRQYLDTYRNTDLADNATYWIGECFYRQSKFQKAIDQFEAVLSQFQDSDRTPSALLKKGYAHLELAQRAQGIVQLQRVICEYAGTDEAHLASQRLAEMSIDVSC